MLEIDMKVSEGRMLKNAEGRHLWGFQALAAAYSVRIKT